VTTDQMCYGVRSVRKLLSRALVELAAEMAAVRRAMESKGGRARVWCREPPQASPGGRSRLVASAPRLRRHADSRASGDSEARLLRFEHPCYTHQQSS
jgi:hypothetical protein